MASAKQDPHPRGAPLIDPTMHIGASKSALRTALLELASSLPKGGAENTVVFTTPDRSPRANITFLCGSMKFATIESMIGGRGECGMCGCPRHRLKESTATELLAGQVRLTECDTDDEEDGGGAEDGMGGGADAGGSNTPGSKRALDPVYEGLAKWHRSAHRRNVPHRETPQDEVVYNRGYVPAPDCMEPGCRCHSPMTIQDVIVAWTNEIENMLMASEVVVISFDHPGGIPAVKRMEQQRRSAARVQVPPREWNGDLATRLDMHWEAITANRVSRGALLCAIVNAVERRMAVGRVPPGKAVFLDTGARLSVIWNCGPLPPISTECMTALGCGYEMGPFNSVAYFNPLRTAESDYSAYSMLHYPPVNLILEKILPPYTSPASRVIVMRQPDTDTTLAALLPGVLDPRYTWLQDLGPRSASIRLEEGEGLIGGNGGGGGGEGEGDAWGAVDVQNTPHAVVNLRAFAAGLQAALPGIDLADIVCVGLILGNSDYTLRMPLMTPPKVVEALLEHRSLFTPLLQQSGPEGTPVTLCAERVERMLGTMLSVAHKRKVGKRGQQSTAPVPVVPLPPARESGGSWSLESVPALTAATGQSLTKTLANAVQHAIARRDLQRMNAEWTLHYMLASCKNEVIPDNWTECGWQIDPITGAVTYDLSLLHDCTVSV